MAAPSRPVRSRSSDAGVPEAGESFRVVPDEKTAKALVAANARERAGAGASEKPATLDEMFAQVKEGKAKELKLVLKADVQGSLEAIKGALAKIPQDEVGLQVIHDAVGDITESDLTLAAASSAVVMASTRRWRRPPSGSPIRRASTFASTRSSTRLLDDVQKALTGCSSP